MDRSALSLFGDTVTCKKFERAPSGQCKHFTDAGYCSLPDELVCVELKRHKAADIERLRAPKVPVQRNLLGEPVPLIPERRPSKPRPAPVARPKPSKTVESPSPFGLTADDVARFKADGIEVQLEAAGEDIWLVPELTSADRQELTVEHLATVVHVASVLPGARLKRVERRAVVREATP